MNTGPICVVGMHRSGTSLTMRVLAAFGLDLGPAASLLSPDPIDNAAGYQEQVPIVELDDELLRALGGHASEPPELTPGWEHDDGLANYVARADRLLTELFDQRPWAFKDPRVSVLLPFWQRVVPELRVIVCIRNPLEVALSMDRRHGPYALEYWLAMWQLHTRAGLAASERCPREIVVYEDQLADPLTSARRIGRFALGHDSADDIVAAAAALPSAAERRGSISDAELLADARVPREIALEYVELREWARSMNGQKSSDAS